VDIELIQVATEVPSVPAIMIPTVAVNAILDAPPEEQIPTAQAELTTEEGDPESGETLALQ
jgi:uncharacterized protein (UPF0254 family)